MKRDIKVMYYIDAGRFEPEGDRNYKYCDQSEDIHEAWDMYTGAKGYQFVNFTQVIQVNGGPLSTVYLAGKTYYWQDIYREFYYLEIDWATAYERLMSWVGMSQNEALQCLAEHFDRRPPIVETEVEEAQ